jgi:hypothetical protein
MSAFVIEREVVLERVCARECVPASETPTVVMVYGKTPAKFNSSLRHSLTLPGAYSIVVLFK